MEKKTRMNKYKVLREDMKDEVSIDQDIVEQDIEDDDFLAFLPKEEKPKMSDTLMNPLSYETLEEDDENIQSALNKAKVNVGKEQYNTRLDILNKIKKDDGEYAPTHQVEEDTIETYKIEKDEKQKKSLLEKLADMSPEEDVEELKEYEKELTVAELMNKEKAKPKPKPVKQKKQEREPKKVIQREDVQEDAEPDSKLVTVLNYLIIVFIVIFVILTLIIAKQLIF